MLRVASATAVVCAAYALEAVAQGGIQPDNSREGMFDGTERAQNGPVCGNDSIARIIINTAPPFEPQTFKIISKTAKILTKLHITTREQVIRRYLALQEGGFCTEERRRESEVILRAQPFLADAVVRVERNDDGSVNIIVETVDELSLVFSPRVTGNSPVVNGLKIGETNLEGTGVTAVAGWKNDRYYRDVFSGKLIHYQLFGRPYHFSAEGSRNSQGSSWELQASHPYITDLQRLSWRVTAGSLHGYQKFLRPGAEEIHLSLRRDYQDAGGLFAVKPFGKLFLIGSSISTEKEQSGSHPVVISDTGIVQDTSSELTDRYGEYVTSRINLLLGYRDLRLMRVSGFDALEGTQDMRKGLQVSALFGKGFKILRGADDDYFASLSVYYGVGNPRSFFGVETTTERRRDVDATQWDGILASSKGAWYYKPNAANTFTASMEFSGGWRQRVPFQLTFRDRIGGVRGYGKSDIAGGQRVVLRLEERFRVGRIRDLASWGGAIFADAGKMWAGDAPFGTTTGVNSSIGVSLVAAISPQSRRLWRVDFAMPLSDRKTSRFEVRFKVTDMTRVFWREPDDVQVGRERSVPHSVYHWP